MSRIELCVLCIGKRISLHEKARYDRRVYVQFQANAWCDEAMMKVWINHMWKPACKDSMLLVMDVHRGQTTDQVKRLLKEECATNIIYVPRKCNLRCMKLMVLCFINHTAGCTSLVQPLDVSFNKPFKVAVERLSTQHMQDNLEDYQNGNINASARRVLFTKWVGEAWEEVSRNKAMTIRSFKKTGIAVAADGSEDHEINIEGLTGYTIESEEDDELDSDDSEDDPFADTDYSSNCDDD